MEFKQDGGQWKRRKLNDTNEFKIVTPGKNIIPIPNFIDTRRKFKKRRGVKGGQSLYHRRIIPLYMNNNPNNNLIGHYYCNLFTGQWRRCSSGKQKIVSKFNNKIRKLDKAIAERCAQIKIVLTDVMINDLINIVCTFVNL